MVSDLSVSMNDANGILNGTSMFARSTLRGGFISHCDIPKSRNLQVRTKVCTDARALSPVYLHVPLCPSWISLQPGDSW